MNNAPARQANRQPVLPFKILCILLYGTQSWLQREGTLAICTRPPKLARTIKKQTRELGPMLNYLQTIGLIRGWSVRPGELRVELRNPF